MVSAQCERLALCLVTPDSYSNTNQQPNTHARHFHRHANQYTFSSHRYSYFHSATYANAGAADTD